MSDPLIAARALLEPPERTPLPPVWAFAASVCLAVSALALAGMVIMGPQRSQPQTVSEDTESFEISAG